MICSDNKVVRETQFKSQYDYTLNLPDEKETVDS